MSLVKIPLPESVLQASQQRIQWVLENFSRICISFSGGKDSTTMLHGGALRPANGKKFNVLFIDWEAQFSCTIQHCENIRTEYGMLLRNFIGSPYRSPRKIH